MKKIYRSLIVFIVLLILVILLTGVGFTSTKYDFVKTRQEVKNSLQNMNELDQSTKEYLNLLVTEKDVIQYAKSGKLNKERTAFVLENSNLFMKLMQYKAAIMLYQISKNNKEKLTERHFMLINGIIKSPKALVAKTGPEYEQEKMYLRGMTLYKYWEKWRSTEFLDLCVKDIFDGLDKLSNK